MQTYIDQLDASGTYAEKIATTLEPLTKFHPAEGYHQDYVVVNPEDGYVVRYALPKVEKLKKQLPDLYAGGRGVE